MANIPKFKLEKAKMMMQAANAKPERPRINEQMGLEKNLLELQEQSTKGDKKANEQMFSQLNDKWKGNEGGSSGDALISGLEAGLKKGSFMEDKERNKKVIKFTEQMRDMVAEQNIKLFEQEKLSNARDSITPRIMAYLDTYNKMSPNDRKVYLQNSMDEYNKSAGTDYKVLDATGSEPWKVIVSDGGEAEQIDLMDFIKTPEQKKLEYYYNSNEMKQAESELQKSDNLERQVMESKISQNKNKSFDEDVKRKEHQEAMQIEKEILDKNNDHVKFIDGMPISSRNHAEKHIKEYTDKANYDLAAEKRLQRAVKIAEDHPALFGNLNSIIASRYNEDPGYLNNILKNKIPKEDLNAMSELAGIVKNIFTDSVKGTPARAMNMFLEKKLEAGSPNQRWTAEAFKKAVNESLEEYKDQYNEHKKVADYGSAGLYYRPRAKSRKNTDETKNNTSSTQGNNPKDMAEVENKIKSIPGITKEDYDEAVRRLSSGK